VVDGDSLGEALEARKLRSDDLFVAEQLELEGAIRATCAGHAGDDCRRADVSTHCVNRDPWAHGHASVPLRDSAQPSG